MGTLGLHQLGDALGRWRLARVREHRLERAGIVVAEIALPVARFVELDPERSEHVAERFQVHVLIVDEHPVVIEQRRQRHARNPLEKPAVRPW